MPEIIHAAPVVPRPQLAVTAQGLIAESFPRSAIDEVVVATAQRVSGMIVGLRAGDLVTNLHCITTTTGVGAGYARMALYSLAGVQLSVSGDANAAFTGTAGLLTIPLATPYTVTADDGYYVFTLTNLATTQPTIAGDKGILVAHVAIGSGKPASVFQATQASFPATATLTQLTPGFWVGAS